MHAESFRTLGEQRADGLVALQRVVGVFGGMVGEELQWRGAGVAGQAGSGFGSAHPALARGIAKVTKKQEEAANPTQGPRLTPGGALRVDRTARLVRAALNEMSMESSLSRAGSPQGVVDPSGRVASPNHTDFVMMPSDDQTPNIRAVTAKGGERRVQFMQGLHEKKARDSRITKHVQEVADEATAAREIEDAEWDAAGGDVMVSELRTQCAALLAGQSPTGIADALRARAMDRLHEGQQRDAASLRSLQRHAISANQSYQSERSDPVMGQSEQPAATLVIALEAERTAAAQRAWRFSERWERAWRAEARGLLRTGTRQTLHIILLLRLLRVYVWAFTLKVSQAGMSDQG